mmetsp:Transcript_3516/g.8806  ORF Transcript_3516/g.8806 Transcript_3516/m.8806 type:complete len:212 (-) Transcript_3516:468-1103(-)
MAAIAAAAPPALRAAVRVPLLVLRVLAVLRQVRVLRVLPVLLQREEHGRVGPRVGDAQVELVLDLVEQRGAALDRRHGMRPEAERGPGLLGDPHLVRRCVWVPLQNPADRSGGAGGYHGVPRVREVGVVGGDARCVPTAVRGDACVPAGRVRTPREPARVQTDCEEGRVARPLDAEEVAAGTRRGPAKPDAGGGHARERRGGSVGRVRVRD